MKIEVLIADDHAIIRDGLKKFWRTPMTWWWQGRP